MISISALTALFETVKDEKLPQHELEKYRDAMIHFRSDLLKLRADLKKKRALFYLECTCEAKKDIAGRELHLDWCRRRKSAPVKKNEFDATEDGQRLLTVEGYIPALRDEIDSCRDRVWSFLRQS